MVGGLPAGDTHVAFGQEDIYRGVFLEGRRMRSRKSSFIGVGTLCLAVSILFPAWCRAASYTVDGRNNVVGGDLLSRSVYVPGGPQSIYTYRLTASDFKGNSGDSSPRCHVVARADSGLGDYATFTLNAVGDTKTITAGSSVYLLFIDPTPGDDAGGSTVEVSRDGTVLGNYTVDGRNNVTGSDLSSRGVPVSLPPGTHTFTLTASTFKENSGNASAQRHVVVYGGAAFGDNYTFTLNGTGDSRSISVSETTQAYLFFIDTLTSDNVGSSTVTVESYTPPPTAQLKVLMARDGNEPGFVNESGDPLPGRQLPDNVTIKIWKVAHSDQPTASWRASPDRSEPVTVDKASRTASYRFDNLEPGFYDIGVSVLGPDLKLLRTGELAGNTRTTISFVLTRANLAIHHNVKAAKQWIKSGVVLYRFDWFVSDDDQQIWRRAMDKWEEVLTKNGERCVVFQQASNSDVEPKTSVLTISPALTYDENKGPGAYSYQFHMIKYGGLGMSWYKGDELLFNHEVNPDIDRWTIWKAAGDFSLSSIAMHELGHALGCGEANDPPEQSHVAPTHDVNGQQYTIMAQEDTGDFQPHTHWLGWSDVSTIREIWDR